MHYQHWFPVVLTLQLMFSQFSCFDSEFTTEDFPLMCEWSFYSEINQEVNRRVSVILDTRRSLVRPTSLIGLILDVFNIWWVVTWWRVGVTLQSLLPEFFTFFCSADADFSRKLWVPAYVCVYIQMLFISCLKFHVHMIML